MSLRGADMRPPLARAMPARFREELAIDRRPRGGGAMAGRGGRHFQAAPLPPGYATSGWRTRLRHLVTSGWRPRLRHLVSATPALNPDDLGPVLRPLVAAGCPAAGCAARLARGAAA